MFFWINFLTIQTRGTVGRPAAEAETVREGTGEWSVPPSVRVRVKGVAVWGMYVGRVF